MLSSLSPTSPLLDEAVNQLQLLRCVVRYLDAAPLLIDGTHSAISVLQVWLEVRTLTRGTKRKQGSDARASACPLALTHSHNPAQPHP
eukprot:3057460-Pleurochrysis_carterae.AAC.1